MCRAECENAVDPFLRAHAPVRSAIVETHVRFSIPTRSCGIPCTRKPTLSSGESSLARWTPTDFSLGFPVHLNQRFYSHCTHLQHRRRSKTVLFSQSARAPGEQRDGRDAGGQDCIRTRLDQDTYSTDSQVSVANLYSKLYTLKRKNQELLYINKKWAEDYRALAQDCEQKVSQMNRMLNNFEQMKEEKSKMLEDFTNVTKKRAQELKSQTDKADREITCLRVQCEALTRRGQKHEQEIKRLNKALTGVHWSSASHQECSHAEQDVWMHQAQVFKEDFLKERRDKERLKHMYSELESRYKRIHAELHVVKAQVQRTPSTGPSPHT
ncbi:uncharacterized protein LOC143519761 [Brachyhypopomus gauderio]|uniref:uncharacterized protein LOC143519761 n=1 Tax=Brachyhypopomus gauderio TaxID=698409 RepID=UPI004042A79F